MRDDGDGTRLVPCEVKQRDAIADAVRCPWGRADEYRDNTEGTALVYRHQLRNPDRVVAVLPTWTRLDVWMA